jgi:hypothetical protein
LVYHTLRAAVASKTKPHMQRRKQALAELVQERGGLISFSDRPRAKLPYMDSALLQKRLERNDMIPGCMRIFGL